MTAFCKNNLKKKNEMKNPLLEQQESKDCVLETDAGVAGKGQIMRVFLAIILNRTEVFVSSFEVLELENQER